MGTLSYDFQSDTIGNPPAGWSELYESASGSTNEVASVDSSNRWVVGNAISERLTCVCDDAASGISDVVISGVMKRNSSQPAGLVYIRNVGGDPASLDGYLFVADNVKVAMYSVVSGSQTIIDSASPSTTSGVNYSFKFEATGTTIRAKWWTGAEPGTWTLSATDSAVSSGGIAVGSYNGTVTLDDLVIESDDITSDITVAQDPVGALGVAGFDPNVSLDVIVTPESPDFLGAGRLYVLGYDPNVSVGVSVFPTLGTVGVAGYDPVVDARIRFPQTPAGALTVAGFDPSIVAGTGVFPNIGTVVVSGLTPSVSASSSTLVDLFFKFKDTGGTVRTRQLWRRPLVTEATTTYTAQNIEEIIVASASGGAFTITMPSAVGREGYVYVIKKTDSSANAVKVDGLGAETIDGSADFDLEFQDEIITIVSDNANWWII